ncbi:SLAP domain-containing protein [Brevibacillus borstelensis]|uniref:SLAP domain-containing protein n=1 Tax=Brevibacillus borstelensis TaxID=45462 RepID=UPI0030C4B27C
MFSFFKNFKDKKSGQELSQEDLKKELREDSTIDLDDLDDQEVVKEQPEQMAQLETAVKVRTDISLHPAWEEQLDSERKYALRFMQAELPDMAFGSVGVTGFSLIPQPTGGVTVAFFIRNAAPFPVNFKKIQLAIYFDGNPFARQRIDLSEVGSIPPFTSRPWEVYFPPESYLHDNFTFKNWKIMMKANKNPYVWPQELELDPEMEARMTDRQKKLLEQLTFDISPMELDTVEIIGFDITKAKDGRLVAGILIRNGYDKDFCPDILRIKISDAEDEVVASGSIDASRIRVRPGTSRPWVLVFPADMVKKPDAKLQPWKLEVT